MTSIKYSTYLKSEHWTRVKEEFRQTAMYRDGRCFICCNAAVEKHVHHLTYKRLGREKMADLRILCAVCHAVVHDRGSCRKLRAKWYPHASRQKLWGLRYSNPIQYAREVAAFFGVAQHPFAVRVCGKEVSDQTWGQVMALRGLPGHAPCGPKEAARARAKAERTEREHSDYLGGKPQ